MGVLLIYTVDWKILISQLFSRDPCETPLARSGRCARAPRNAAPAKIVPYFFTYLVNIDRGIIF